MSASKKLRRRRDPGSDEGQRIVRAILAATEQLFQDTHYDQLSTNRIAESAGVSIGSLYQYFPNKQAIVAELARSLEFRALELLRARAPHVAGASLREAIPELVGILLDARMGSLGLRRQLLAHVPRDWLVEESTRVDAEAKAFVCEFLRARSHEIELRSPELATFVLFHSVESVVEAAVEGAAHAIADGSLQRELVKLVLGYLGVSEPKRKSAPPGQWLVS